MDWYDFLSVIYAFGEFVLYKRCIVGYLCYIRCIVGYLCYKRCIVGYLCYIRCIVGYLCYIRCIVGYLCYKRCIVGYTLCYIRCIVGYLCYIRCIVGNQHEMTLDSISSRCSNLSKLWIIVCLIYNISIALYIVKINYAKALYRHINMWYIKYEYKTIRWLLEPCTCIERYMI